MSSHPFIHLSTVILDSYPKHRLVNNYIEKLSPFCFHTSSVILLVSNTNECYGVEGVEYKILLHLYQFVNAMSESYDLQSHLTSH
jgi:hypothetical protein